MRKSHFTIRCPSSLFSPCDNKSLLLLLALDRDQFLEISLLPTPIYLIISFVLEVAFLEYQVDTSF